MYLLGTHCLLADADWMKFIPAIIFFVVWVLNQLFSANKAKPGAPADKGQPRRVPGPPPANPAVRVVPPRPQAQLQTEIEEFLKRANQRREQKARPSQRPAAAPAPPRPRPAQQVPLRREIPVEAEVIDPRRPAVAALAQHHLATRQFDDRTSHLVDDILQGDRARLQHEEKVFQHNVGKLADTSSGGAGDQSAATVAAPAPEPFNLADLFGNPANLRQAVILTQIFERPIDRW